VFSRKHMTTFGLDVGSYAVRVVQLHRGEEGYRLAGAGVCQLGGPECEEGVFGEAGVLEAIRHSCREAQVRGRHAVCGVSGTEVAIREFDFAHLPVEEVGQAVYLEAAQVCPFELERSTVEYVLADSEGRFSGRGGVRGCEGTLTSSGVMVAAANEVIEAKRRLVEEAGYRCVLMDAETLALMNGFESLQTDPWSSSVALLDVGNRYTHLAIMREGELPFARDLAHAGAEIMGRLAVLSGSTSESECGEVAGGVVEGARPEVLAEACEDLLGEVDNTLRYYTVQQRIRKVERIYISGGMSLYPGFVDLLKSRLPGEVSLWNPLSAMSSVGEDSDSELVREQGSAFAVATGLAMRTV